MGLDFRLGMSIRAIEINDAMPLHTLQLLRDLLPDVAGRRVLVLGVPCLEDVADTRSSPTATFPTACRAAGACVLAHDSLVNFWPEASIMNNPRLESLAADGGPNALVFAMRHREYLMLDAVAILRLFPRVAAIVDGKDVLSDATAAALANAGCARPAWGKAAGATWAGRQDEQA
jgi:UDP-N-acetyl-D-glucosamine dehydrogenase